MIKRASALSVLHFVARAAGASPIVFYPDTDCEAKARKAERRGWLARVALPNTEAGHGWRLTPAGVAKTEKKS